MSGESGSFAIERRDLDVILANVGTGDAIAFEELYRRTSARLFGVCLRVLSDRGEAEEALQDSYISVWRRAATFDRDRGRSMTWLVAIARNQAIDRLRATRPRAADPIASAAEIADHRSSTLEALLADEQVRQMAACLEELAPSDKQMIQTTFYQSSTYRELAERSGTPLGTVKTRIRRVLAQLRDCLR